MSRYWLHGGLSKIDASLSAREDEQPHRIRWSPAWPLISVALVFGLILPACVSIQLPTMAHSHVGHALTAWPDTPGQKGLLEVARMEATVAAEHAAYAVEGARNIASVKLHAGHVLHAVDPKLLPDGPGAGYGLTRALQGSVEHLGYAREVPDAGANLRAGLPAVIAELDALRRESQVLAALARDARLSADEAHVVTYAQDMARRSTLVVAGLDQAQRRLDAVLAAEQPPYRPIARRYLFGVIRLPSGDWAFDPDLHTKQPGSLRSY